MSVSRSLALVRNYSAPMEVWKEVPTEGRVCVGKEWYRFPSHYFLKGEVGFLKAGFRGFLETVQNDLNREEADRYVDVSTCTYIVDFLGSTVTDEEPDYTQMGWKKRFCKPFLEAAGSSRILRAFWVPESLGRLLKGHELLWGEYCLLEREDGRT
ncbi:hypothetical protein BC829DRAFT_398584 [Chytridium lagenaria]|nr:hypothetical protein BC829DRAFT_398584 [Chytridium lagenaria]